MIEQGRRKVAEIELDSHGINSGAVGKMHRIGLSDRFQGRQARLGNPEVTRSPERDCWLRIRAEDGRGGNVPIDRNDDGAFGALVRECCEFVLEVQ